VGPTRPSTIPAARASAINGPLLVKMHSFLGMLLGPHKNLPQHKLALRLYDESQISVKCVTVSADQTKQQPMSASVPKGDTSRGVLGMSVYTDELAQ
jgi:hypothetical protein